MPCSLTLGTLLCIMQAFWFTAKRKDLAKMLWCPMQLFLRVQLCCPETQACQLFPVQLQSSSCPFNIMSLSPGNRVSSRVHRRPGWGGEFAYQALLCACLCLCMCTGACMRACVCVCVCAHYVLYLQVFYLFAFTPSPLNKKDKCHYNRVMMSSLSTTLISALRKVFF